MAAMFDSNAMREIGYVKADQYQRNGNGGSAFKVHASNAAYHNARGYGKLTKKQQAEYRAREFAARMAANVARYRANPNAASHWENLEREHEQECKRYGLPYDGGIGL